jgi:hypothetical protein
MVYLDVGKPRVATDARFTCLERTIEGARLMVGQSRGERPRLRHPDRVRVRTPEVRLNAFVTNTSQQAGGGVPPRRR